MLNKKLGERVLLAERFFVANRFMTGLQSLGFWCLIPNMVLKWTGVTDAALCPATRRSQPESTAKRNYHVSSLLAYDGCHKHFGQLGSLPTNPVSTELEGDKSTLLGFTFIIPDVNWESLSSGNYSVVGLNLCLIRSGGAKLYVRSCIKFAIVIAIDEAWQ